MKAKQAIAAALAIATVGLAATPQTIPQQQSQNKTQRTNDAVIANPRTVRQGRKTALNPTGGQLEFFKHGTTPKQYGTWLQQTGRQKWVKKSR